MSISENHAALKAQRDRNRQLILPGAILVSMLLSSVGSVLSGRPWMLLGSVPIGVCAAWMFFRTLWTR